MRRVISFLRWLQYVLVAALVGIAIWMTASCARPVAVKPTPPLVTPCIAEPVARVPDEPARPKALTDNYVVAMVDWANELLGVITADRIAWRGERRCIRGLAEQNQIR